VSVPIKAAATKAEPTCAIMAAPSTAFTQHTDQVQAASHTRNQTKQAHRILRDIPRPIKSAGGRALLVQLKPTTSARSRVREPDAEMEGTREFRAAWFLPLPSLPPNAAGHTSRWHRQRRFDCAGLVQHSWLTRA